MLRGREDHESAIAPRIEPWAEGHVADGGAAIDEPEMPPAPRDRCQRRLARAPQRPRCGLAAAVVDVEHKVARLRWHVADVCGWPPTPPRLNLREIGGAIAESARGERRLPAHLAWEHRPGASSVDEGGLAKRDHAAAPRSSRAAAAMCAHTCF